MGLCRIEDDFTIEKPRWVITLSNGETIFQDDGRPGEVPASAWIRLKNYVLDKKIQIVDFKLQFCSHIEQAAPTNAKGYYFTRKIAAIMGGISYSMHSCIVGYFNSETNRVYAQEWAIPEIMVINPSIIREVSPDQPELIVNPKP